MRKGFMITFESTAEGVGKTTQARRLCEALREAGHDVLLTREPGGTDVGKQLREILLTPRAKEQELSKATELFLMFADRAQHYVEVLKPALKSGKIVVCDRFFDSTLTYQGRGRGWKTAFLYRLHQAATGGLLPDLTFVLDGTPHHENLNPDRFEREGSDFFEKVKRGMLHLAGSGPRYVLLNANTDETGLAKYIMEVTQERLLRNP